MEVRGHLWQTVRLSPPISPRNQTQMVRLGSLRLHQRLSHPLAQQRSKKKKANKTFIILRKRGAEGGRGGGQRTALWLWLSPSTVWVLERRPKGVTSERTQIT